MKLFRVWFTVVGLVLAALAGVGSARAEVTGSVEMLGFDNAFRPGAWTPLLVRLRPDAGSSGTYQIVVEQQDLDSDLVSYVRTITLTAPGEGAESGGRDEYFMVYFLPEGVKNKDGQGLPDLTQTSSLDALNNQLRVYLADEKGRHLLQLRAQQTVTSVEPLTELHRGAKVVLYVRENGQSSSPAIREFQSNLSPLLGVSEDVRFIGVTSRSLPTSALGYQGIDAIVWAAGAPPDRTVATEEPRYRAMREWLAAGGRLVVMQNADWAQTAAWGDLLPVTFPKFGDAQGTTQRSELANLIGLVGTFNHPDDRGLWTRLKGPHTFGLAVAKPGALVEDEMYWDAPLPRKTVWLARAPVGAGCVTYVAQDLGAKNLSPNLPPPGWAKIWCHVLDYRYVPFVRDKETKDEEKLPYEVSRTTYEYGKMVLNRMELTSRVGALIGVSVLFFLIYWLAAGPGSWVFLKLRGKSDYSWFAFAAVAGGATLVTLLVVKLILRGSPDLHHFTLVRVIPGEPALVESRLGLYIPRDGDQHIALPAGATDAATAIAPYALHPNHAGDADEFPAFRRYDVPVKDVAGDEPVAIDVPYRSTAKRLQFTWRGDAKLPLSGAAGLTKGSLLSGNLTNTSGQSLSHVFMTYRIKNGPQRGYDSIVYLPQWKDGQQLSLADLTDAKKVATVGIMSGDKTHSLDGTEPLMGVMGANSGGQPWDTVLRDRQKAKNVMSSLDDRDDSADRVPFGYFMLSIFDRVPFYTSRNDYSRADVLRLNARFLDASAAVSAGQIVIIGLRTDAPLPIDLTVNGDRVPGSGTTLFQFVLPLDRSKDLPEEEDDPSTLPSTPPGNATPSTPPPPKTP